MKPKKHTKKIDANFAINNGCLLDEDLPMIFGEEVVSSVPADTGMLDLLVSAGIFSSKSQARKNGVVKVILPDGTLEKIQARDALVPPGFSEFVIGKLQHRLTIWNPIE